MRIYCFVVLSFILIGCNNNDSKHSGSNDNIINNPKDEINTIEIVDSEQYATTWLVVVDSGNDYYYLRKQMFNVHINTQLSIDTMGRYYNIERKEIILPDSITDAYSGAYFPRRYGEYQLSIEHATFYGIGKDNNTMLLIAGILHSEDLADSLNNTLHDRGYNSFVSSIEMYMGCMH